MNPGAVEEAGATARSFFETMKGQPAILALVLCNILLVVFIFYALVRAAEFRDKMLTTQYEYQREISQILAKCVVPEQRSELPLSPANDASGP